MTTQEKKGFVLHFFRTSSPGSPTLSDFLEAVGCSAQQLAAWVEGKEDIPEDTLAKALKYLEEDRDTYDWLVKNLEELSVPGYHALRP